MNGETVKLSFTFVNFFEGAKFKLENGISSDFYEIALPLWGPQLQTQESSSFLAMTLEIIAFVLDRKY